MMPADKGAAAAKQTNSESRKNPSPRPPEPALKCPRCDSPNTKFCYYNNYNLSQPRHFCKTCRRYWTKGGALRNVPVGGGCRKNKKLKSSSRLSDDSKDHSGGSFDSAAGFNLFHHGVAPPMSMDYQYGRLPFSRLNSPSSASVYNHLFSFGDLSSASSSAMGAGAMTTHPCFDIESRPSSLMGIGGFPVRQGDQSVGFNWGIQDNNASMSVNTSLASSIESLSSINQDLHWRLQQQRLAMLYGGENNKEEATTTTSGAMACIQGGGGNGILENQVPQSQNQPQPILFQNLEISKPGVCGGVGNPNPSNTTEWLFENSYTQPTTTTTSSNSNGNDGMMSNWNGVQAGNWSGMHSYSDLPQ